jgi:hypothetical protein
MTTPSDKSRHLADAVDWSHPAWAGIPDSARTGESAADRLSAAPAIPFRFEYGDKKAILAFLRAHYAGWRDFDRGPAGRLAAFTIEQARGPRALGQVAALGRAWWGTDDPAWGAAFERFYRAVPTGDLFNWTSFTGAQVALELDAWFLLRDCPGFSREGRVAFLDHLVTAAQFAWDGCTSQWGQLALGPEGHNWYLHGIQGLPHFGLQFPGFSRSTFLLDTALGVVAENLRAQYRIDGGARETAPHYQLGSAMGLWDIYCVATRNGCPVPGGCAERCLAITRWLLKLATPLGGTPAFGDSFHEPGDLVALAAVAAALTGDPVCKWAAEQWRGLRAGVREEAPGSLPESAFWRVGLAGARAYEAVRAAPPPWTSAFLPATGYAAMRADHAAGAAYLAVAAAERGPIVTSHGHTDLFTLEILADGVRFIGEPGHAVYGTSPGRDYDQKTESHTVLTIRGEEQLPQAREWRWRGQVRPAVTRWISEPSHDFIEAAHEGFYRYPERQVIHWRKIFFRKPGGAGESGYWLVFDRIEAMTDCDWAAYFHGCVPGRIEGRSVWFGQDGGTRLRLTAPPEDGLEWEEVVSDGLTAFRNERKLEPGQTPVFSTGRKMRSGCFVWGLFPVRPGSAVPSIQRRAVTVNGREAAEEEATAVEVDLGAGRERVVLCHRPHNVELACGGVKAWGMMLHAEAKEGAGFSVLRSHTTADGACGV